MSAWCWAKIPRSIWSCLRHSPTSARRLRFAALYASLLSGTLRAMSKAGSGRKARVRQILC
eukprot:2085171-Pyramimonas_sp.AAC.2